MAYVFPFDPTKPAGSDPANVDDDLRALKGGINERFNDVFGFNYAVDDPLEPTKIGPALTIQGNQIGTVPFNAGNSGTSLTLDFDNGDQQGFVLTGNCTLSFSNVIAGRNYTLFILQDGVGGRTVTFPSSVRASNGVNFGTPLIGTEAGRLTIIGLFAYSSTILIPVIVAVNVNVS